MSTTLQVSGMKLNIQSMKLLSQKYAEISIYLMECVIVCTFENGFLKQNQMPTHSKYISSLVIMSSQTIKNEYLAYSLQQLLQNQAFKYLWYQEWYCTMPWFDVQHQMSYLSITSVPNLLITQSKPGWVADILKLLWNSYLVIFVNVWIKSENKCHHQKQAVILSIFLVSGKRWWLVQLQSWTLIKKVISKVLMNVQPWT